MYYPKNILILLFGMLLSLQLQAQNQMVSGNISTITDLPMAGVNIQLIAGESTLTTTTDEVGNYTFENVPTLTNIQLIPTKADTPINGVSSLDLVLMTRHILGLVPFNMPDKYIAMDVNKSGSITAFDLIQLRQLILGLVTEFDNNDAWRFIEKGQLANITFNQTNSPEYLGNISNTISFDNNEAAILNFIGIKIGDASGNATP